MLKYIFLATLTGMPVCLLVMMVLGLIMLFSPKSKKELKGVKTGIAIAASVCGVCMIITLIIFVSSVNY